MRPSLDAQPYAKSVPRQVNSAMFYWTKATTDRLLLTNVFDFTADLPTDVETNSMMFRGANGGSITQDTSFFKNNADNQHEQAAYAVRFNMFDMISNQATGFTCNDIVNISYRLWVFFYSTSSFGLYVKITSCSPTIAFEKTVEFSVQTNVTGVSTTVSIAAYTITQKGMFVAVFDLYRQPFTNKLRFNTKLFAKNVATTNLDNLLLEQTAMIPLTFNVFFLEMGQGRRKNDLILQSLQTDLSVYNYETVYITLARHKAATDYIQAKSQCSETETVFSTENTASFVSEYYHVRSPTPRSMNSIACKGVDDRIGLLLCTSGLYTPTLPGCLHENPFINGTKRCSKCYPGYRIIPGQTTCTACSPNCLRCDINGCLYCKLTYIRVKVGVVFNCILATPSNLYNPTLQSEYTGTNIGFSAFVLQAGLYYEATATLTSTYRSVLLLDIQMQIQAADINSIKAYADASLYINGIRVTEGRIRHPSTASHVTPQITDKIYMYAIKDVPVGSLIITLRSWTQVTILKQQALLNTLKDCDAISQCCLKNSALLCIACDMFNNQMSNTVACVAISPNKYIYYLGLGSSSDIQLSCHNLTYTKCAWTGIG